MLYLAAMRKVAGIRKGWHDLPLLIQACIPSAMIKVQMRIDHDIHRVERDPGCSETLRQQLLGFEDGPHLLRQLVADARLNHNRMLTGSHDHRVQSKHNAILRIGGRTLFPHRLRHHAEHRAAVEQVRAVGQQGNFKIADAGLCPHQRIFVQLWPGTHLPVPSASANFCPGASLPRYISNCARIRS